MQGQGEKFRKLLALYDKRLTIYIMLTEKVVVLRITAFVFTIAHDIKAPAANIGKRGGFLYHVGALSSPYHLLFNHFSAPLLYMMEEYVNIP